MTGGHRNLLRKCGASHLTRAGLWKSSGVVVLRTFPYLADARMKLLLRRPLLQGSVAIAGLLSILLTAPIGAASQPSPSALTTAMSGAQRDSFLPVDEAFRFEALADGPD